MHLMYTLDEHGTRLYTLKVRHMPLMSLPVLTALQKITDDGKITKSAHPGEL